MKKNLFLILTAAALLMLVSWGPEGHSTVAEIASDHLTPAARSAVTAILNGQSMSSVSSWADQIKNTETAPWHFLNLPLGLNFDQFTQAVKSKTEPNIYSALTRLENELADPATSPERKLQDLKYIIHLVGDAHQPMHVSRKEDRGGNGIHVTFMGHKTNLHSIWDGLLIKQDETNYHLLATKVDKDSPQEIQRLQDDELMVWLFESYSISSKLYSEVEEGSVLGQDYYDSHIPIVEDRLEKGGIRLAGVLNKIFN